VGYTFRKSRRQELLFAIELDGCAASAAADRAAFRKNAKISVTVRVQEADLPPSDHAVSLSAHDRAYCLMPLQLVTKPKDRRTIARQQQAALDRQQRAIEEGGANPRSLDAAAAAEVLQWECPVQWVRVDPEGEWLAEVRVPVAQHGLEGMVTAQLTKERPADVAAQAAAVAYLKKRAEAGSTSATRALLQCAGDETVFCRVRADAAVALAVSARDGTQRANLAHTGVARAYRARRCDPKTGLPKPSNLGGKSMAEAVVDEGFLRALGAPRDPSSSSGEGDPSHTTKWTTPLECVELLIDALNHFRADGDPMDGGSFVATALLSLGNTRPPTAASFAGAANAVARWARRDAAVCGAGGAAHAGGRRVTVAAIHALKHLLCAGGGEAFAKEKAAGDAHANAHANEKPPISPFGSALRFAREISADAAGDPCRAVRRAGASLAFALEWRWGGRTGPARALALAALACKAEPSAGARADVLWDARDAFCARGGESAAAAAWASAACSSPDGRALAHWTTNSLLHASALAGPEAGCAAAALLHALAGRGGWHDAADAQACALRAADVEAALASGGGDVHLHGGPLPGGPGGPHPGGSHGGRLAESAAFDDEAERAERRKRKEERRRAKAEKEERRKARDARRAARRAEHEAAMAAAAAEAGPEPSGLDPSGLDPSGLEGSEGALTGTGALSDGGLTGALSEGTRLETGATLTGDAGVSAAAGDDEVVFAGAAAQGAGLTPAVAAVAAVPPIADGGRRGTRWSGVSKPKRRKRPPKARSRRPTSSCRGWARSASGLRRRRLRSRRRRTRWRR
jgi:hypothetical protein